jgi:hypothetical protein
MFIFSIIISLLIPGTLIGFGLLWGTHAPKQVSYVVGYKTAMAQKNSETWAFAQQYWAKQCANFGLPLPVPSVLAIFLFRNGGDDTLGFVLIAVVAVQIVIFLLPIIPTELALRKNFDQNGHKKTAGRH